MTLVAEPAGAIGGYVLAGGRSSRMGTDKALLLLDGEPLIAHALAHLASFCAATAIAGGAAALSAYGRLIPDGDPGRGPLAGIVAALLDTTFGWNALLAVDVPFLPLSVWQHLAAVASQAEAVAILPRAGGRAQPLCGLYRQQAAPALQAQIGAGRGKVLDALTAIGPVHFVDFAEAHWFTNLNTPADLNEAQAAHGAGHRR